MKYLKQSCFDTNINQFVDIREYFSLSPVNNIVVNIGDDILCYKRSELQNTGRRVLIGGDYYWNIMFSDIYIHDRDYTIMVRNLNFCIFDIVFHSHTEYNNETLSIFKVRSFNINEYEATELLLEDMESK